MGETIASSISTTPINHKSLSTYFLLTLNLLLLQNIIFPASLTFPALIMDSLPKLSEKVFGEA